MSGGVNTTMYGSPDKGKARDRSPAGRTCEVDGCTTVLSTYNGSTTCWLHTPRPFRHALAGN